MISPVIHATGVSKRYSLKASRRVDRTLAGCVMRVVRGQLLAGERSEKPADSIWAIKDIDLDVMPGEVMGIIGPNGSGKSTLLKIIARVIAPTHGRVVIEGRVGSMLELGIGFHPMLTGRENVYFAGALLDIPRRVIRQRIDEIIEFSGIPEFIDVPVNKYSSGMRVRLAFSLMTIIQPEVFLIDEVLGVGDAEFQARSRERIKQMVHNGRAVLLVSHNVKTMTDLCDRVVRLERGMVKDRGCPEDVAKAYLKETVGVGRQSKGGLRVCGDR